MIEIVYTQKFQLPRDTPPNLFIGSTNGEWKMDSRDENGVVIMKRTVYVPIESVPIESVTYKLFKNGREIDSEIKQDPIIHDTKDRQQWKDMKQQWKDMKQWHKHAKHYR